jgi:hypothetical protein
MNSCTNDGTPLFRIARRAGISLYVIEYSFPVHLIETNTWKRGTLSLAPSDNIQNISMTSARLKTTSSSHATFARSRREFFATFALRNDVWPSSGGCCCCCCSLIESRNKRAIYLPMQFCLFHRRTAKLHSLTHSILIDGCQKLDIGQLFAFR